MATIAQKVHEFTLTLAKVRELTPEMAEAIIGAGCNDATLSSRDGVVSIAFDREAATLGDAIGSAIKDVERAGYLAAQVTIDSVW